MVEPEHLREELGQRPSVVPALLLAVAALYLGALLAGAWRSYCGFLDPAWLLRIHALGLGLVWLVVAVFMPPVFSAAAWCGRVVSAVSCRCPYRRCWPAG